MADKVASKAVSKGKKVVAKVAAPAKKAPVKVAAKKKADKGDSFLCEVCGLSVIVDEWGDVYEQEILCCGKPMKQKAKKAKVAAKKT